MIRRSCLLVFCLALVSRGVSAQEPPPEDARPTVTAVRLEQGEAMVLDGHLDEGVWARAVPAADFKQQIPQTGAPPTERTEVRFVFTANALYMGVTCFDSEPDKMLGNTMKRDEGLRSDDRFMWEIDTFLDARSGYFFEMNPSGLMADSLMNPGGQSNRDWDGIWDARVRRSEIGWTIEIELPFRTFNFNPAGEAWGVNFQRTVRRKNEESLWTAWGLNQGLRIQNTGLLLGINNRCRIPIISVQLLKIFVIRAVAFSFLSICVLPVSSREIGICFLFALGATLCSTPDVVELLPLNTHSHICSQKL